MSDNHPQWQPTNPPTPPVQKQSWFARNKVLTMLLGVTLVVLLCCCGGAAVLMEGDTGSDGTSGSSASEEANDTTAADDESSESADDADSDSSSSTTKEDELAEEEPAQEDEETSEEASDGEDEAISQEQENANSAAENYLDLMPFSKKGLIEQLSSDAGDGYPQDVAEKAVEHIEADVDWNEQAAKAAKNYQDLMPMSRSEMINQLSSDAGDGFTQEQAEHGADAAGL